MEELLNKLIEKGWKPFELSYRGSYDFEFKDNGHTLVSCHSNEDDEYTSFDRYSWRDLVSKESGLWQFCVENKLVETDDDYSREKYRYNHGMKKEYKSRVIKGEARKYQVDYEYWIIESALKDESELEQFLLDNIKVDG